jgi:4-amino-4-deoxy-L-arabinose transferase-like glycosyltransferase
MPHQTRVEWIPRVWHDLTDSNHQAARKPAMPITDNGLRTTDNFPSLAVWLHSLWSEVLFPGRMSEPSRVRWTSLLLLLVVPGVLLYPTLDFHLFEPDEGRYAEIGREMLERGEWIVPYLQGEPYLDKPPLLYWLVVLSYRLFGVHDWSARLVPALAVHVTILLAYLVGRRSLGERSAFWGALLLSLAPGFVSVGRLLILDGLLTLWVSLSLLAGFEALRGDRLRWLWWLVAAAAVGLGILTKGPIALILFVPPLAVYSLLNGKPRILRPAALVAFAAVVLIISAPWYEAICFALPNFGGEFFWKHNIQRFFSPFDHLEPFWYYVPILLGGLLPGSLWLVGMVRFLGTSERAIARQRSPELGFMLLAGGWCVLFFSLSGCKLPTYILPAYPFLALGLGHGLAASRWQRSRWPAAIAVCGFAILLLAHHIVLPWYACFRSPFSRETEVTRLCADSPVVCYPRSCDSVAFYLGRADFLTFRGKEAPELVEYFRQRPRTVVLFTHRHSLATLREVLPPNELEMTDEMPLFDSARAGVEGWKYLLNKSPLGDGSRDSKEGMCWLAVVRRVNQSTPKNTKKRNED